MGRIIHPNLEAAKNAVEAYIKALMELQVVTGVADEIREGDGVIVATAQYYDENGRVIEYWK